MDDHLASMEAVLVHAGTRRSPGEPAPPPLVPASIFVSCGEPDPARSYGRGGNPGWEALEAALGAVERARALVFASGQAASMALMLALGKDRDQILLPSDGYYNARTLAQWLRPHGARPVLADLADLARVERELGAAPSLLWAETPTNPLLRVCDIARLAELAAAAGAPMVVDNTVATGLLQQPLDLGATAAGHRGRHRPGAEGGLTGCSAAEAGEHHRFWKARERRAGQRQLGPPHAAAHHDTRRGGDRGVDEDRPAAGQAQWRDAAVLHACLRHRGVHRREGGLAGIELPAHQAVHVRAVGGEDHACRQPRLPAASGRHHNAVGRLAQRD